MTSETYKKDVMRWVNTGYSISFRCRTAVVADNAGILFFTIDANVTRVFDGRDILSYCGNAKKTTSLSTLPALLLMQLSKV